MNVKKKTGTCIWSQIQDRFSNKMQFIARLLAFLILFSFTTANPIVPVLSLVREFPKSSWIENIAVRENGYPLLTLNERPELYTLDPFGNKAEQLLYRFSNATRPGAITQINGNRYVVVVGTLAEPALGSQGSHRLWDFDLSFSPPKAKSITRQPINGLMNAVTRQSPQVLTVSDSALGSVFRVDVSSGETRQILHDDTTESLGISGINGVRFRGGDLFYTNTVNGIFARVALDPTTSLPTSAPEILATGLEGIDDSALGPRPREAFAVNNLVGFILIVSVSPQSLHSSLPKIRN